MLPVFDFLFGHLWGNFLFFPVIFVDFQLLSYIVWVFIVIGRFYFVVTFFLLQLIFVFPYSPNVWYESLFIIVWFSFLSVLLKLWILRFLTFFLFQVFTLVLIKLIIGLFFLLLTWVINEFLTKVDEFLFINLNLLVQWDDFILMLIWMVQLFSLVQQVKLGFQAKFYVRYSDDTHFMSFSLTKKLFCFKLSYYHLWFTICEFLLFHWIFIQYLSCYLWAKVVFQEWNQ